MLVLSLVLAAAQAAGEAPPSALVTPTEAVTRALGAAPELDRQSLAVRQARRDTTVAAVDLAPDLELTASYTRLSEVDTPPLNFGGMEIDNPFQPILDNYSMKASVTWPVSDLFLAMLPAYQARRDTVKVQKASLDVERNKVAQTTLEAYYQLARIRAGIDVAANGVELLEAMEAQLADLFTAGQVTRADTLNVTAQLAEARSQHQALIARERVVEARLASLMQVAGPLQVTVPEAKTSSYTAREPTELVVIAKDRRPEVRMLKDLVQVHRHSAAAQRGAALPHLVLQGNFTYANPNQRIVPPTDKFYDTWDATVAISWSPKQSLKSANGASESRTQRLQAEADLVALERGLDIQVANALAELDAAERVIVAAEQQLEAAEAAYAAQTDLLQAGMATVTETLQAESSARRARHALLDARVDLALSETHLTYAMGTLLETTLEGQP